MDEYQVFLILLTYNQERYVGEAVKAALCQDYPNLNIIISDDCSTDGTFKVIEDIVKEYDIQDTLHRHNVLVNRNETNMGLVPHVNKLFKMIGEKSIILLAGGDDISMPDRVRNTIEIFRKINCYAVTGQAIGIDADGVVIGRDNYPKRYWTLNDEYIKSLTFMAGRAGLAVKYELWETYGPLLNETPTEDSTLRFRALLSGQLYESDEIFLKYRRHPDSLSFNQNVYRLKTTRICRQYSKDIRKAFELRLIDNKMKVRLKRKLFLYGMNRALASRKSCLKHWQKAPFKLLQIIIQKTVQWI